MCTLPQQIYHIIIKYYNIHDMSLSFHSEPTYTYTTPNANRINYDLRNSLFLCRVYGIDSTVKPRK